MLDDKISTFLDRFESLLERIEATLPQPVASIDWQQTIVCRWQVVDNRATLQAVSQPRHQALADLLCIDQQKALLKRNTQQFVHHRPANNALLWGARGTGKSSLVKALLHAYWQRGLRIIEVDKKDLFTLGQLLDSIATCPQRFILFFDDLSFSEDDGNYKPLKAALDGSVSSLPPNVLIYATSNRRHMLPEYFNENRGVEHVDGEIHYGDATEEKISLSDRFGLWVSFYPYDQEKYLTIVYHWLRQHNALPQDLTAVRAASLRWALARGSRSGRCAFQFANDWVGRHAL